MSTIASWCAGGTTIVQKVRLRFRERALRIGVAARFGQAEVLAAEGECFRIDVDQRDDLDRAVGDVGLQEFAAPALAERADADVDDALRHSQSTGAVR
jgi:hypothetical protein